MRTATPGRIEVAFSGERANFPLNAQFSIPAKGVTGIWAARLRQDHDGALHRGA